MYGVFLILLIHLRKIVLPIIMLVPNRKLIEVIRSNSATLTKFMDNILNFIR